MTAAALFGYLNSDPVVRQHRDCIIGLFLLLPKPVSDVTDQSVGVHDLLE
jgi:hypothetical protein